MPALARDAGWSMKSGFLLFVIAAFAIAIGYLELRHHEERSVWQTERVTLTTRLEHAERQAEDYADKLSSIDHFWQNEQASTQRLAELNGQILDAAADLARLESDRAVADQRAEDALKDLKHQVRSLSSIEIDVAALDKRRGHLVRQVETVEERLQSAEFGAAERQKRAEELDRDIAGLAMRKETLLANLKVVERDNVDDALAKVVAKVEQGVPAPEAVKPGPPAPPTDVEQRPASDTETADGNATRGLYQFSSLSLDSDPPPQAASEGGKGGLPPKSGRQDVGQDDEASAANWAEDQYLLGLRLVSSAEQSSSTRELNEAILAFRAVLDEWPRDRDPMRWAIAQSDLGYALALLGKRRDDTSLLSKAVEACDDALTVIKRDRAPLLWAAAQHHLGVSLGGLADLNGDQDVKLRSIEALTLALDAFKGEGANADAKKVEGRLRHAYNSLPQPKADQP